MYKGFFNLAIDIYVQNLNSVYLCVEFAFGNVHFKDKKKTGSFEKKFTRGNSATHQAADRNGVQRPFSHSRFQGFFPFHSNCTVLPVARRIAL